MELVYLWVGEYKNIKEQGFDFSPRFQCDYNPDTKKLIIDENDDYINIFPDNINITAIVGENGSGKSSVLGILSKILTIGNEIKYFYILKHKNFTVYSNNIKIETDFALEISIPITAKYDELLYLMNDTVELQQYIDMYYLNISHLEREEIIYNDDPSDSIKYLGIYAKNDLEKGTKNSDLPTYSEFDLSKFNFLQSRKIITLLQIEKYKKLIFKHLKIPQPYYVKLSYDKNETIDSLKLIKKDFYKQNNKLRVGSINQLINLLSEIKDNPLVVDIQQYNKFYDLVESIYSDSIPFKYTLLDKKQQPIVFSAGENTIMFYLERIAFLLQEKHEKPIILLFDEIELYLHPAWQQKILNIILDIIKASEVKNFHLILTSHSPFLISDLPKENVIFLNKYKKDEDPNQKDGNCKVLKDGIKKQTFGANIHTLLSDGFFMSGGLMGEFAKGKIEAIKKFYESVIRHKDNTKIQKAYKWSFKFKRKEFQHIHSIIGERFLKTIIGNYLDELELLLSNKNDLIDKRIEALKKEQEYLEGLKND